ncbi:DUF5696 domain-containing protein [Paenibacillus qinlingensis]|uniref:Uncharacterized protein n=1 Tax=Paenibacillus qinlingensis TaxID=1837343 RepID=A0ABU1NNQ4_9BACL|nr:DUF5696 domain-containing protein [Paenibacillus qinlingensis]MDR6549116.1 hypothetical protein [Paenibacillus qinlingensis]
MVKPIWKNRKIGIAAGAVLVILGVGGYTIASSASLTGTVDFSPRETIRMPITQGAALNTSATDLNGWTVVKQNQRYALKLHVKSGNLAVKDLSTGFEWTAFAKQELLDKEKVGGTLRTNLESPFIMEYFEASAIQRKIKNAKDPNALITYSQTNQGFAADYTFKDIEIGFRMEFDLTDDGVKVSIPVQSISEKNKFKLISIESLPFFGAAGVDSIAGYIFIPDGPGGLIRFPQEQDLVGKGYEQPVYGAELTTGNFPETNMSPVSMPVFGMKQGSNAFLAIIDKGEYTASIKAYRPGIISNMNSVSTKFVYREEYDRRLSLGGKSVRVFQDEMAAQDRVVDYHFLRGDQANYVGMAQTYRTYMLDTNRITNKLAPTPHVPLDLTLIGGDSDWNGNSGYTPATTFKQAQYIEEDLKKSGVEAMHITYEQWQEKGSLSPSRLFSLEGKLGGDKDLQAFVDSSHSNGYKVLFKTDVVEASTEFVNHSPKSFGIRSIEGNVMMDKDWFWFTPNVSYNLTRSIGDKLKGYGIDGIQFSDIGNLLFRDYNPSYNYQREDSAYVYQHMLDYSNRELGTNGISLGNAYALQHAKHIQNLPNDINHFYDINERVPFAPIVLHGNISYSMGAGNIRDNDQEEFLRAVEYGAVPSFMLTYESTRTLQETYSWGVYSSRYASWKDKLLKEYKDFDRLAAVYDQPITNHRQVSDGVFETQYGNGISVIVDYNSLSFRVEKGGSW